MVKIVPKTNKSKLISKDMNTDTSRMEQIIKISRLIKAANQADHNPGVKVSELSKEAFIKLLDNYVK